VTLGPGGRRLRYPVLSRWKESLSFRLLGVLLVVAASVVLMALGLRSVRADGSPCPSSAGWTPLTTPPLLVGRTSVATNASGSIAVYGADSQTVYLAGPHYGVLQSQDCGSTWSAVPSPWPGRPFGETVRAIAVDHAGRLYVALFGEPPVMTSDGGSTWQMSGNVFYPGGDALGSVPFAVSIGTSPNVAGLAFSWLQTRAGRGEQVGARTVDGGMTWQAIEHLCTGNWITVASDPSVVYAATLGESTIFQSRVSGNSATCSQLAQVPTGITSFATSLDGSYLWVATSGGLYRSGDQGITWQLRAPQVASAESRALSVDPGDPNLLFSLDQDGKVWLYRESDAAPSQPPSQVPR
jgi:photosystem II stability/assembly factor-like uncharacterized protein